MQGYFKDEERTLRTIDEEGWFHTGDIGEWTAWGTLRVIDKIKTVFKLANGDYVDPDRLEAVYVQSQYINQVGNNSLFKMLTEDILSDICARQLSQVQDGGGGCS